MILLPVHDTPGTARQGSCLPFPWLPHRTDHLCLCLSTELADRVGDAGPINSPHGLLSIQCKD
jgi:hypothetical protein